jgi:hypothetical protein
MSLCSGRRAWSAQVAVDAELASRYGDLGGGS